MLNIGKILLVSENESNRTFLSCVPALLRANQLSQRYLKLFNLILRLLTMTLNDLFDHKIEINGTGRANITV